MDPFVRIQKIVKTQPGFDSLKQFLNKFTKLMSAFYSRRDLAFTNTLIPSINVVTIIVLFLIWFFINRYKIKPQIFAFNYIKIVIHGEWWRILSSS
eukprot:398766_1